MIFESLRNEHLISLWIVNGSDDRRLYDEQVGKFRELFTKVNNRIIQARIPENIICIFQDHTLIALPKPNNDIRPIGLQLVLKKIACKVALKATKTFNTAHFTGLQYCLQEFGTEKVSLFFRAAQQSLPSNDFWSLDGDNGFGRISRVVGLFQTKQLFPKLLPLLKMIYGTSSNAWYFGLKTGIESIKSEEGIQQGDVLSMWFYAISIHPLLQRLRDILGPDGFTKWYADDGYVNAPFEKMIQVIEVVKNFGPACGYYVKISKGTYLLGKCSDLETAIYRKNQLIGLGLDENTIIIHPENDPSTQTSYGCKILGSFIGTDEYIRTQLDIKYEKLAIQAESVKEFPNKQAQHLILLYCISAKINHIQRLTPPELTIEFVDKFDNLKRSVFSNIIGHKVSDFTWSQACLLNSINYIFEY
jgi:hypothetical protein